MIKRDKATLRAAVLIHEHLAAHKAQPDAVRLPASTWREIQRCQRQILLAHQRQWLFAAQVRSRELVDALHRLRAEVYEVLRPLESRRPSLCRYGLAEIYRDLRALPHEFPDIAIDFAEHELAVTTDPIVLEQVDLGRFEIRLAWQQIHAARQPYRIVALEPHPAARNESVTHPHVQDDRLCEGDKRGPIAAALSDGRLYDFFTLVSQVLHTYGKGSSYVELDRWHGVLCAECGDTMDEDDQYLCQHCESTLCPSCAATCHGCQEWYCAVPPRL